MSFRILHIENDTCSYLDKIFYTFFDAEMELNKILRTMSGYSMDYPNISVIDDHTYAIYPSEDCDNDWLKMKSKVEEDIRRMEWL